MSVTIDNQGWIAEAIGIYWPMGTFGPFASGQPQWIVLHGTAWPNGTAQLIGNTWASQSANGTLNACVHIIIDKDGSYVQGMSLLNTTWGNSGVPGSPRASYLPSDNLNFYTISIEHCKYDAQYNSDELTPAQRATSFAVIKAICEKYNIPKQVVTVGDPSGGGIIRHKDCDGANRPYCPGPYPFADLQNFLNGGPEMFSNQLCIAVWNSYFLSIGKTPPPRDTGIFNDWRAQWINGYYKGCCLTPEYNVPLPNGDPGVAQNYAGGTCVWDKQTSTATWL